MGTISVKAVGGHIMTITGRNLEVFDFLEDKIMPIQKHKPRIVNYDLILIKNEPKK